MRLDGSIDPPEGGGWKPCESVFKRGEKCVEKKCVETDGSVSIADTRMLSVCMAVQATREIVVCIVSRASRLGVFESPQVSISHIKGAQRAETPPQECEALGPSVGV